MPLIRCQWFDDDRQPIAGGCKWELTTCTFVHPSSHRWDSAARKRTAVPRNQMSARKGPSGWSDAPGRDRNANNTGANTAGLGAKNRYEKLPPTGPNAEKNKWDTGAWYKNRQESGQSDAGPSTSTRASASATTKPVDESWGQTNWGMPESPSWGDQTKSSGISSPAGGNKDGAKDSGDGGQWGSGGWGCTDNGNATWGTGTWGTSDAGTGLENAPTEEPQLMQVDSPPPLSSKGKEKEAPRRDSQDTIMSPPLPDPDPPMSSSCISLPKKRKDPGKQPATSLTVDVSGNGAGASGQPLSPSHSITGAQNVYKDLMRHFFKLVRLKIEKSECDEKYRAWTSAQGSQPYALGQEAAGTHWNQAQKQLDKSHNISRNIEETMKLLLSLPDVSTPKISLDEMEEKMEQITKYAEDTERWMKELAEAQEEAERRAQEAAAANYPIDITPHWTPKEWPEHPSADYIHGRTAELQDQVADISNFLDHTRSVDDVDSLFEEGIQMSDSLARLRMEELDPEEDPLTLRIDNAGGQVAEMMSTIADYTGKFVNQKKESERWKAERDANLAVKAKLEEKIAGFEQRSKERHAHLQEMSNELRELREMEQAYPFHLINPLLEEITNEVIEKEMRPALMALHVACEAASTRSVDRMTEKIQVAAQPTVESTNRLREQARRSRASTSS
ncbi:uncharacterized protein EV420DRAFT_1503133 [Desarmillaria tabescens]|uniref:C3H1-type domain-containing protein n=1 Tax=Armillaria tabescens TaxID=1929756 RepID=A0AA39U0J4_ARMTA|nr:uncharacterized protein EV420DRAFT_1503133 [Desarmillaria tabescens]KAK0468164.1 hypothetical protein EV420DRAFT_1503133 [Desarmillaria tabescens]